MSSWVDFDLLNHCDNPYTQDIKRSSMKDSQNCHRPELYEICVQGHLQDKWAYWFYGLTLIREEDGTTTLCGPLPDQTALHSVLQKIRDMNLRLISVNEIKPMPEKKNK